MLNFSRNWLLTHSTYRMVRFWDGFPNELLTFLYFWWQRNFFESFLSKTCFLNPQKTLKITWKDKKKSFSGWKWLDYAQTHIEEFENHPKTIQFQFLIFRDVFIRKMECFFLIYRTWASLRDTMWDFYFCFVATKVCPDDHHYTTRLSPAFL